MTQQSRPVYSHISSEVTWWCGDEQWISAGPPRPPSLLEAYIPITWHIYALTLEAWSPLGVFPAAPGGRPPHHGIIWTPKNFDSLYFCQCWNGQNVKTHTNLTAFFYIFVCVKCDACKHSHLVPKILFLSATPSGNRSADVHGCIRRQLL